VWTQYSIRPKRSAICTSTTGVSLGPPASWMQAASRSLQPFLHGSLSDRPADRPTDHATRSVAIGAAHSGEAKFCYCPWLQQVYLLEQSTQIHHAGLSFVSVHQMAPPLTEVGDIQLQVTQTWTGHCAIVPWHRRPPPLSTNIGAAIYAPSNDMTHLEWRHWTAADGTAPKTPLVRHWAYYSSIDREGMKGRVWPGWLTYSERFTHISGNPSATGLTQDRKVRGSKTDVAMRCTDGGEIWRGGWLLHANQCRGMGVRGPPKLQILLKLRNIKANMDVGLFLGRFLPNCHRLWAALCTIM